MNKNQSKSRRVIGPDEINIKVKSAEENRVGLRRTNLD